MMTELTNTTKDYYPQSWGFPYTSPYPIQTDLMQSIYRFLSQPSTIDQPESMLGVFESPTGTGKSLSLICGVMTWLQAQSSSKDSHHHQDHVLIENKDEPAWIKNFRKRQLEEKENQAIDIVQSKPKHHRYKYKKKLNDSPIDTDEEESQLEFESLISQLEDKEEPSKERPLTRVYFCSRTHSQLAQTMEEFSKYVLSSGESIRSLALGSRKVLCINQKVKKDCGDSLIKLNETCTHLQKEPKGHQCPYLEAKTEADWQHFQSKANALTTIDIEDLAKVGEELNCCPYYASRELLTNARFITLPYAFLLSKNTRNTLNIQLKDNIIIFDEAHNLIDGIQSLYSVSISKTEVEEMSKVLMEYWEKYQYRFSGQNGAMIQQLLILLKRIAQYFTKLTKNSINVFTPNETLIHAGIESFNGYKLMEFLEHFELCKKLIGWSDWTHSQSSYPLQKVVEFVLALSSNSTEDARVLYQSSDATIHYTLLHCGNIFYENVLSERPKKVLFAGGTLSPIAEFIKSLLPPSKVSVSSAFTFSCGHIIDACRLSIFQLSNGVANSAIPLRFTMKEKDNKELLIETGKSILQMIRNIPNGTVLFFQSYSWLSIFLESWKACGLYSTLSSIRKVFIEPKESKQLDAFLNQYQTACKTSGAVLFAVVGGKLSEGINFADEFGRGIILIGLPYPNITSPELMERLAYYQRHQLGDRDRFLDDLMMRSVNQSIGRAIRHINDYAVIILLDVRYGQDRIKDKLPNWMKPSLKIAINGETVVNEIITFFKNIKIE